MLQQAKAFAAARGDIGRQDVPLGQESVMLEASEFRQYTAEAIQSALMTDLGEEKTAFLELANVWMCAAQRVEELSLRAYAWPK
jgi:hypothetical protein